jgi:hypothetical protein
MGAVGTVDFILVVIFDVPNTHELAPASRRPASAGTLG